MATFPTNINALSELLERRHLTAAEGLLMGLMIVAPPQAEGDLGYVPGGKIKHLERLPYFDLTGNHIMDPKINNIPFVRYRIERPSDWIPTPKGTLVDGHPVKDPKYLSPRGSSTFVYIPRLYPIDWTAIAANAQIPIIITEGEFKSYSMCKVDNYYCIGLTGVQAFGKNGDPFPYPMSEFAQLGREWQIVFDADDESDFENPLKKEVAQAAMRLATKLSIMGAEPVFLYIARTETFRKAREKDPHCKMGLDDFLFASDNNFKELLSTGVKAIQCMDMAELRSKYVFYTGAGPHIVNIENGTCYKATTFVRELEVNRVRLQERANGAPMKISVADEFMKARDRPEIDRKVFWPNYPMGLDAEKRLYNEWRGFAVEGMVQEGERDKYNEVVAIWRKFIGKLFGEYAEYFEQWLAHIIQKPGEKTSIAVILASPLTGIGKSLLGEIIRGMIGSEASVAIELDRAMKDFNGLLAHKVFLQMDEAEGKFSGHESKLNDLITSDKAIIERKGFEAYEIDNFARVYMTSNHVAPIRLTAENRRMLVIKPEMTRMEAVKVWSPWVTDVVAKELKSAQSLRLLMWYLMKRDLTGWNPTARVIQTEAMMEMVEASRSKNSDVVDGLWDALESDPEGWWVLRSDLRKKDGAIWSEVIERLKAEGGQTLTHLVKGWGKMVILDRTGKMPKHKPPASEKWMLDNRTAELSVDAFKAAERRASIAYDTWKGIVLPSGKY